MDISAVATDAKLTDAASGVTVELIKKTDDLQAAVAAELFKSIGLGANINAVG